MATTKSNEKPRGKPDMTVLDFFNVATDRMDGWNDLNSAAIKLSNAQASGKQDKALEAEVKEMLATCEVFESFWAYPGLALFKNTANLFKEGDYATFAQAVKRINRTLMSGSYRRGPQAWSLTEEVEDDASVMQEYYEQRDFSRPYFEVLVVDDKPNLKHQ